jgi:hypothetical protein
MPQPPERKQHLLIAGTGRAGTTLLVQLLSRLGFDTNVDANSLDEVARAGLEWSLTDEDPPYVVKNPKASTRLRGWIESGSIDPDQLDMVVIPVRDLSQAARSRARVSLARKRVGAPGGLDGVRWARFQDLELGRQLSELMLTLAEYEVPQLLLAYPKFARDPAYCYRRLRPLLRDLTLEEFETAWRDVVRPELIHDYTGTETSRIESLQLYARHVVTRARRRLRRMARRLPFSRTG